MDQLAGWHNPAFLRTKRAKTVRTVEGVRAGGHCGRSESDAADIGPYERTGRAMP